MTMPKVHEMFESKFLKKEDCEPPITVTIDGLSKENVGLEGVPEFKWCAHFRQPGVRPLILNRINSQLLAKILGSEDSANWIGRNIELYNDMSVSFQGKLIGGVRVRQATQQQPDPDVSELEEQLAAIKRRKAEAAVANIESDDIKI